MLIKSYIVCILSGSRVIFPLRHEVESSSRPRTPSPPSMKEAGELKLPSTLKRIDETNKSFILHPLVSEASGAYPFSGKHGFLSFQDFLSVLVVQLPKHFVRQIHTAECPMIIEIVDVEMLIIGLIDAEDIPIHARLCTIVRTK